MNSESNIKTNINIVKLMSHDLINSSFNCGDPGINELVINSSFANMYRQIYVHVCKIEDVSIGYLAFSIKSLKHHEISNGYIDNEYDVGVVCIEYVAISENEQGKGYGTDLLRYFIFEIISESKKLPIRHIVLQALPNKIKWYEEIGFKRINENSNKMYLDLLDDDEINRR